MNRTARYLEVTLVLALGLVAPAVQAQQPPSRTAQTPVEVVPALPVPRLVKFTGTLKDELGKIRTGVVGVTLAIYKEQDGGAALWVETQNVELDEQGRYTVLLGATKSEGLPLELFTSGEPRWLGVQVNLAKELEQPRVLLVSVPYALKAADADTLGGKPLSSFVLATPATGGVVGVGTAINPATGAIGPATIGGGGNQNYVAKFDVTGANVINSSLYDNGQVGIGTTSPGALLDVQLTTGAAANALSSKITLNNSSANTGNVVSAFKMTLLDESTATNLSKQPARFVYLRDVTATGGVTAFDAVMTATSFLNANAPYQLRGINIEGPTMATGTTLDTFYGGYIGSGGGAGVVTNRFALVTEPGAGNVGLGTTAPSQKLEVAGNLKISGGGNALVFPDGSVMSSAATGVGGGTITGVMAGTGLTGGGTTGGVALNIASGGITNALLGANSVTNANIADGSLSSAKITGGVASLGTNTFTGSEFISGSVGIGTMTPSARLTVNGNISGLFPAVPGILVGNPVGTTAIWQGKDTTHYLETAWLDPDFARISTGGGQPLALQVLSGGNVGIGTTTPNNLLSLSGQSAASFGMDPNPNPGVAGNGLTITGGSASIGATDQPGGDLILASGNGTGLGASGNSRIQTAGSAGASGTTGDTLIDRQIIVGKAKALTLSSPGFSSLFSIHLVGTNTAGGRVRYMIRATDGGSQIATESGVIQYLATANSITCNVQTTDKLHLGTVNSGCTPGFFNPGSQPGVSVFDNVTFSSPAPIVVHEVFFTIENESGSSIRLEP
jgi:hypothetical protein